MAACTLCGQPSEPERYREDSDIRPFMEARTLCFHCGFWAQKVSVKDDPRYVRVEGKQYRIGEDHPYAMFRGFGGARFAIHFHDGRIVHTSNLWHNGEIPEWYRAELPDNAVFVDVAKPDLSTLPS